MIRVFPSVINGFEFDSENIVVLCGRVILLILMVSPGSYND